MGSKNGENLRSHIYINFNVLKISQNFLSKSFIYLDPCFTLERMAVQRFKINFGVFFYWGLSLMIKGTLC